jgi:hypothetical protein
LKLRIALASDNFLESFMMVLQCPRDWRQQKEESKPSLQSLKPIKNVMAIDSQYCKDKV